MAEKSDELKTTDDKIGQAKELFARGSRNYLVKAYNDAADDLSQVCDIYEEVYGQLSDELGMPYLLYAKSLIALAEDENKVLAVPDEQNDDDDDDDDVDEEEEEAGGGELNDGDNEAEAKPNETDKQKTEVNETAEDAEELPKAEEDDNDGKDANGVSKKDDEEKVVSSNEQADENVKKEEKDTTNTEAGTSNGVGGETNAENEDEDDGANLQVAWEILELAVRIFERQGEPALSKLADAYAELAGISLENSHFDAAIEDFKKSLEIHMKLPDDNRRFVAEIHYKIALAHLMLNSFDDCVLELKRAFELIDEQIEDEKLKENKSDKNKDIIKDLEEAKQDIQAKIVEVEEAKMQSIEEVRSELSKIMSTDPKISDVAGSSSSSGAANVSSSTSNGKPKAIDISHLIKRKKPDSATATESEASPAKRPAI